jgi:hypothetical protein
MKPEEALKALGVARPHGQDDDDPRVVRARESLADEPQALARAAAAQRLDVARAVCLQSTPIPPGLKESLLLEMAAAAHAAAPATARRTPFRWIWAAAAVALLAALGGWRFHWAPRAHFMDTVGFREAMAYYIAEVSFSLDFISEDLSAIGQWLEDSATPGLPELPATLAARTPLGCKSIQWGETRVSLICFFESIPDGRLIHLFVAPRNALSEEAIGEIEATLIAQGFETRGWQTSDWVCVLVPSKRDMRVAPLLDEVTFVRPA